ncbi:MAG: hypothetical protein JKX75_00085 [Gammaproteobacteria bacterium]|nr:hypothetical protein [Gammaproteobacteria bacterium]
MKLKINRLPVLIKIYGFYECNRYVNLLVLLNSIRLTLIGLLVYSVVGCGGASDQQSSDDTIGSQALNNTGLTDLKIAQSVYFDQRIPDEFYQEQYSNDAYYNTSHIKNTDLLSLVDKVGVAIFDLSSDDFNEALAWSEQAENFQSIYKQLVGNSETSLYHQFSRVDPASPEFIFLQRVFKLSILDRNGINDDYKGRITIAGMTAADVKLIVEYLWTFTISNNYGYAVLSSTTVETVDDFIHTMLQANLTMSFNENCDLIEVYEINYTVSKASGFIMKSDVLKRVITSKRTGDYIEICGV